jgi:hypothetical protein
LRDSALRELQTTVGCLYFERLITRGFAPYRFIPFVDTTLWATGLFLRGVANDANDANDASARQSFLHTPVDFGLHGVDFGRRLNDLINYRCLNRALRFCYPSRNGLWSRGLRRSSASGGILEHLLHQSSESIDLLF